MTLFRKLVLGCAVLLAGCAEYPQTEALFAAPEGLPRQAEVSNIRFMPHVDQQGAPAALAMALTWSGARTDAAALAPWLDGQGLQSEIVAEARLRGREAYPVSDLRGVLEELAAGHPVLVRQEPSGRVTPVWRYALLVGYDLDARVFFAHSGRLEHTKLPIQVFEGNWSRAANWGVVVLDPKRAPVSSTALAAYRGAAPAASVAVAAKPAAAPAPAAKRTELADVTPTAKPAAGKLAAVKPAAKPATSKVAAKPKPRHGDQVATVPAEKPAKAAPAAEPAPTAKGRQAVIDKGLAGLLAPVPVAYRR